MECSSAPLSSEGDVSVNWQYIHTGGLNLTGVSLLYSLDQPLSQFHRHRDVPLLVQPGEDRAPLSFTVQNLTAGNGYIFRIISSNAVGNSSITCPPVTHVIGKKSYDTKCNLASPW